MIYEIFKKDKILRGKVDLPASKSISNRILIIQSLCDKKFRIENLSNSTDTVTLKNILTRLKKRNPKQRTLDAGDGGTTFRFLTALLAITEGNWILNGSQRMKERPIGILADTLQELGADIDYTGEKNFPPLKIKGRNLVGGKIKINASVSSQFISALLMLAPKLKNGLTMELKGEPVSSPYILMTLKIMEHFGIRYSWRKNIIKIARQEYQPKDFRVEADWSAASYFYAMAAFADEADLLLNGLLKNSLQGDFIVSDWMKDFGVQSIFTPKGVRLAKSFSHSSINNSYDFIHHPDLFQTMMVLCAGKGLKAEVRGVSNLEIKETDRIKAMSNELGKLGVKSIYSGKKFSILSSSLTHRSPIVIHTYSDHRMAMSFVPLAMLIKRIRIENPEVVKKSFPAFWNELKKLGFGIREV